MPRLLLLTLLSTLTFSSLAQDKKDWKLIWSDEFNTPGLPDPTKWSYETGFIRNNESQFYTPARPENARVEDGHLIIEARKEQWKNPDFRPAPQTPNQQGNASAPRRPRSFRTSKEFADYTSASLHTLGKATWTYGRIEVRAKLPKGRGTWPAIWMLGVNRDKVGWPACGEIDIMEFVGFDPTTIHANIHTRAYNHVKNTGKGNQLKLPDPTTAFHTYAVEWHPDRLDFFLDDQKYFTFKNENTGPDTWPFDQPHYLIVNLAIGGAWGGQKGIDDSAFPTRYSIDYVRVYQRPTADPAPKQ